MKKSNFTFNTQEKILSVIYYSEQPLSLTAISKLSKKSIYQVKAVVDFLEKLNIIDKIVSSGNLTFITLKKGVIK